MNEIAVIGMSCRFPGAQSLAEYRKLLTDGRCVIRPLSEEELQTAGVPRTMFERPDYVRKAAPLDRVGEYDTSLFRLSPTEARAMDPQHYTLLECVYEALEAACCRPDRNGQRVGLFAGADLSYYSMRQIGDGALWDPMGEWANIVVNDSHFLTTSIAYRLGFRGPAIEVRCACSTSLVAVHLAVQSLLVGDCDVAVAGGVSIRGPQTRGYLHRDGSILSRTGSCRPFDKGADGTVLSSGAGVVVLQRLSDAQSEGSPIWSIVKGTAVNNDGKRKLAYSAPSGSGQADVIRRALTAAQVDACSLCCIEAHGTGTPLGDAVEFAALAEVLTAAPPGHRCVIGSVKSNFGHLESAAGIAGLIKTVLSLKFGEAYPTANYAEPSPELDLCGGRLMVATRPVALGHTRAIRRAGVSSFGIGGTNCHVIVEHRPLGSRHRGGRASAYHVLPVSGASMETAERYADKILAEVVRLSPDQAVNACYSLATGRETHDFRMAKVVSTTAGRGIVCDADWQVGCSPAACVVFAMPVDSAGITATFQLLLADQVRPLWLSCRDLRCQLLSKRDKLSGWECAVMLAFDAALWLLARGVRPAWCEGPAGDVLARLVEGSIDAQGALKACTQSDRRPSQACSSNPSDECVTIELLGPRSPNAESEAIQAYNTECTDPLELQLTRCLARLWVRQVPIKWASVYPDQLKRVVLPTCPFAREPARRFDYIYPQAAPMPKPEAKNEDTKQFVSRIWRELLCNSPRPQQSFLAAGGDSLLAMQFAVKASQALDKRVPPDLILESTDCDHLATRIVELPNQAARDKFALSPGQESIWFAQAANPGAPAYNVYAAFRVRGSLDPAALHAAFDHLIRRQPALRTAFSEVHGRLRQRVYSPLPLRNWRFVSRIAETDALRAIHDHSRESVDLRQPPLLSVLLVRTASDEHLLSVVSHHIVSDEWSAQLMIRELLELYRSETTGQPADLAPVETTLGAEAERVRQSLTSAEVDGHWAYWRNTLAGSVPLDFPTDSRRMNHRAQNGAVHRFILGTPTVGRAITLAQKNNTTLFVVLAAAFFALLHRFTGDEDICIGTNIAGRMSTGHGNVVGLFTNTVPLRCRLQSDTAFVQLLRSVHRLSLEAHEHQLPLRTIVREVGYPHHPGRNPLFDFTLVLQNVPRSIPYAADLTIEPLAVHNGTSKFDAELCFAETAPGRVEGHWEYDVDLFAPLTIAHLDRSYRCILDNVLDQPDTPLSALRMVDHIDAASSQCREHECTVSGDPRWIWHHVQEQAKRAPAKTAVIDPDDTRVAYDALVRDATSLTNALIRLGAGPGSLIGILCERSHQYLVAILAVEACGAAFVPLDPSLPNPRIRDLVEHSEPHAIVVDAPNRPRLAGHILSPDSFRIPWLSCDGTEGNVSKRALSRAPDSLAYVLYTSGTAGHPKGAMVARRGFHNHLFAKISSLQLDSTSVVAQTAPLCFDVSIWQFLAPVMVGGVVRVISEAQLLDGHAVASVIRNDNVSILEVVPSYLSIFLETIAHTQAQMPSLRYLIATGEQLPVDTCRRWFALNPDVPIVNAYGPTECSDDVTHCVLGSAPSPHVARIPIGRALPGIGVHVLDSSLNPVPVGARGELCVSGVAVGLGYLRDPDRTDKAFVPSPFEAGRGSSIYRTGDIGRLRSDGLFEYLGRRDGQVKLRGVRIELEEVESILHCCSVVEQVALAVNTDKESLVAYVKFRGATDTAEGTRDLYKYCEEALPKYMVPSSIVPLRDMPKGASGKTSRRLLANIATCGSPDGSTQSSAVSRRSFATLHQLWCEVLALPDIPVDADFFCLGGDSLKAMRLASLAQNIGLPIRTEDVVSRRTLSAVWAGLQSQVEIQE
ncbi:MAG: amino acid adenylation domain-containing protein [Dehalococcoidia bacterium]|nr:amino acid adenylation domain-containing protein [Dehalococcoidia bacterium]